MFAAAVLMLVAGAAIGVYRGDLAQFLTIGGLGVVLGGLGVVAILGGLLAELQMRNYYESQGQKPYLIGSLTNFDTTVQGAPREVSANPSTPKRE